MINFSAKELPLDERGLSVAAVSVVVGGKKRFSRVCVAWTRCSNIEEVTGGGAMISPPEMRTAKDDTRIREKISITPTN